MLIILIKPIKGLVLINGKVVILVIFLLFMTLVNLSSTLIKLFLKLMVIETNHTKMFAGFF